MSEEAMAGGALARTREGKAGRGLMAVRLQLQIT